MRNSLLAKRFCAEEFTGLKLVTEDMGTYNLLCKFTFGRGAFLLALKPGRKASGGAIGSENVGMSNHNSGESPGLRKPKVFLAMAINQDLGGPKPSAERPRVMDSRLIFRPFLI